MIDIVELEDGEDMVVFDSIVSKAGNVLSIQLGDLEYSDEFGVDLEFFLTSEFQIQNASFQAYLVQRLTEHQVNVAKVLPTLETLMSNVEYYVGDVKDLNGGLIL